MNATIETPTFSDRAMRDAEWGPARRDLARGAADEITLDQRDAALCCAQDN